MSVIQRYTVTGLGSICHYEVYDSPPPGYDPKIHAPPAEDGTYLVLADVDLQAVKMDGIEITPIEWKATE